MLIHDSMPTLMPPASEATMRVGPSLLIVIVADDDMSMTVRRIVSHPCGSLGVLSRRIHWLKNSVKCRLRLVFSLRTIADTIQRSGLIWTVNQLYLVLLMALHYCFNRGAGDCSCYDCPMFPEHKSRPKPGPAV